jgi:copper/silver efflux system protein
VAEQFKKHHYVNAGTVNPDIVMGKPYYEFEVDREEAARYGMTTMMVNQIVSAGLGGVDVTTTVEGRERYPIQIRFQRDVRERIDELRQVPVVTATGDVVPLERWPKWPPRGGRGRSIAKTPGSWPTSPSPLGRRGRLETVEAVMDTLRSARENGQLKFPDGNSSCRPVGSFQNQIEANRRLMWIMPMVILINCCCTTCTSAISPIRWSCFPVFRSRRPEA